MDISKRNISIACIIVLVSTVLVSVIGMVLMSREPLVLQGQVEALSLIHIYNFLFLFGTL